MPVRVACALIFAFAVVGCGSHPKGPSMPQGASIPQHDSSAQHDKVAQHDNARIPVVTTFSTLNSFVEGVGGDRVRVRNLVPVGASPETYQPTPQDIAALSQAQLVVQNGLGIEAWLQQTLQNAANRNMRVLVLSDGLPHIDHNPHLWMNPVLARVYVGKIRDALAAMDPAHKAEYARNANAYDAKLVALQTSIAAQIATIPPAHRAMIIFHNAFDYYNRRFGIRTVESSSSHRGKIPTLNILRIWSTLRARITFAPCSPNPSTARNSLKRWQRAREFKSSRISMTIRSATIRASTTISACCDTIPASS